MKFRQKLLLGLTGNIGSGKTTVSDYICNKRFGWTFTEYSFAKPLKEIALILGFTEKEVYGTQEEKTKINNFWGVSGREFLQKFGTEICRDTLPNVIDMGLKKESLWIRLFKLFMTKNKENFIVVSDARFTDECQAIKDMGGYIIKIIREENKENKENKEQISLKFTNHKSEKELNDIKPNVILKNNCSLEELKKKLDSLLYYAHMGFLDIPNSILYL